jgi:dTDP-4-amino-4,6-dideoxy-D-galactose acyltransferase
MTKSNALASILDWDSTHFGFVIARITNQALDPIQAREIDTWARAHQVRCLYFLCPADQIGSIRTAEQAGYHLVDIRMTYEQSLRKAPPLPADYTADIRPNCADEVSTLEDITRTCQFETRFSVDSGFPPERSRELYVIWVRKSCEGYAQQVLVAHLNGQPVGYISCHLEDSRRWGSIGLVAVASQVQGRGIGRQLVMSALHWFHEQNVETVSVVTQGRNLASQRLYQACGFLTRAVHLWYHRWYEVETL